MLFVWNIICVGVDAAHSVPLMSAGRIAQAAEQGASSPTAGRAGRGHAAGALNRDFTAVADTGARRGALRGRSSGRPMDEKRGKPRQKSLLRGVVYFDGSPCAVECVVREMSDAGARLKFETPPLPADGFELDIPMRGLKLRALVKWQQGDEIGVSFAQDAGVAPTITGTDAPPPTQEELAMRVVRLEGELAALHHLVKRLQQKINSKVEAA